MSNDVREALRLRSLGHRRIYPDGSTNFVRSTELTTKPEPHPDDSKSLILSIVEECTRDMPIVHSFFTDLRRVAEKPSGNRNRIFDFVGGFIDKDASHNLVPISAILIHAYLIEL